MSQPSRSKKAPAAVSRNPVLGIASALIVVAIFVILGVRLARVGTGAPAPAVQPTAASFAAEPTVASAPTSVPAAGQSKTYSAPPPMTIDPAKQYTATITTPRGDIVVKLRPDLAPKTVNSFVFLAREGFYNDLTWHRVLPQFMAQGGDPTGTGGGGPGYAVPAEFTDKVLFDKPGLLAMARSSDPDSAGSQFFITTAPAPHLSKQYTIFGEVVKGQEIVDAIPLRDPDQNPTTPGEKMLKILIEEK